MGARVPTAIAIVEYPGVLEDALHSQRLDDGELAAKRRPAAAFGKSRPGLNLPREAFFVLATA